MFGILSLLILILTSLDGIYLSSDDSFFKKDKGIARINRKANSQINGAIRASNPYTIGSEIFSMNLRPNQKITATIKTPIINKEERLKPVIWLTEIPLNRVLLITTSKTTEMKKNIKCSKRVLTRSRYIIMENPDIPSQSITATINPVIVHRRNASDKSGRNSIKRI
jgi:hypothetical protein